MDGSPRLALFFVFFRSHLTSICSALLFAVLPVRLAFRAAFPRGARRFWRPSLAPFFFHIFFLLDSTFFSEGFTQFLPPACCLSIFFVSFTPPLFLHISLSILLSLSFCPSLSPSVSLSFSCSLPLSLSLPFSLVHFLSISIVYRVYPLHLSVKKTHCSFLLLTFLRFLSRFQSSSRSLCPL